jgi:hypothetical protein
LLDQGDTVGFSRFLIGNVANAYGYLRDPTQYRLLADTGLLRLEERGAAWLFMRWVTDQYGEPVLRRLSESAEVGATNIERATGGTFANHLAEWLAANYVSDLDSTTVPARLQYTSWSFRRTFGGLHEDLPESFPLPFPITLPPANPGDFTTTVTLRSGSGEYYRLVQAPGAAGFTLQMQPIGPTVQLAPQVTVYRLR